MFGWLYMEKTMNNKERILVIMDTYYPDSRATTFIMQQILERLSEKYDIHVFALDLSKRVELDKRVISHNGVVIEYARPISNRYSIARRVNAKLINCLYFRKYKTHYYYDKLLKSARDIIQTIKKQNINKVLSVSSPHDIHICCEMVVQRVHGLIWFPVCFDPHAFNCSYSEELRKRFYREESILYRKAQNIFMLPQSVADYQNCHFRNKIKIFELPMMVDKVGHISAEMENTLQQSRLISFMYTGNFYRNVRNPDKMLGFFDALKDVDFRLMLVGSFSGWGDDLKNYLNHWKYRLGEKIVMIDRVSRIEMERYLQGADFLVSIGNTTYNQCPSKVLEYISTGKPIIHFQKINKCSALPYLLKYPNACVLKEDDDIETNKCKIKKFIEEHRGVTVNADTIMELYSNNLYPHVSEIFLTALENSNLRKSVNR